jgi:hypothetical protein
MDPPAPTPLAAMAFIAHGVTKGDVNFYEAEFGWISQGLKFVKSCFEWESVPRPVFHGVSMDSLNYHKGPFMPYYSGSLKPPYCRIRGGHPQGRWPAAVALPA